ncbi:DUF6456 domain-containing protein [Tabrizicola sp. J26]|uniref:DUF6456 domain-containing protein n=1 Tax=Alitabrizicola rongguiensis TaxID=2909234 RepID=UPI001F21A3D3|nr:DUF6456 domain-containing protein [Tabrizicola rongguiensis]MCF1709800.1 DUF6456 domain-containing protein [Tabrizicola rongguiensis]
MLPPWLPEAVRSYIGHIEDGVSLRELARSKGCAASTVLRQVRRYENRRDDPLIDGGLAALGRGSNRRNSAPAWKEAEPMSAPIRPTSMQADDPASQLEIRRVLRRLAEPGATLVVAPDMEMAVILRAMPDGQQVRTGVVERASAETYALRDWVRCRKPGRVAQYEITSVGRAALKRLMGEAQGGLAEAQSPYAAQHREMTDRIEPGAEGPRRIRYNMAESPVALLGRRKDRGGEPFLGPDLVAAAERLREDFELAQMGPRVAQNWDRFLTAGDRGSFAAESGGSDGSRKARDRVAAAPRDLGPGLGDMVLRCCCFLEGLEAAERRLGWSARSGKIVLRIALQRLKRHYDETYGRSGPLIG